MENKKTYKFVHCNECGRQLIAPRINGWTGLELPTDVIYTCAECKRKQEQEQEKKPMFEGTITPWPPEIVKKIFKSVYGGENEQ